MTLQDIQVLFNRALSYTFNLKKNFVVFCVLALCGLMAVFFQGLGTHAGVWIKMSLIFLPIFLCAGILLALGVVLVRIYHDEIKSRPTTYQDVLSKSWDVVMGASYFSIPIILSYLLLWMLLGIFFLLRQIPGIGEFFSIVLVFAPFLINLGSLVLCILSLAMLFFLSPVLAFRGFNRLQISQTLARRFKRDPFSNMLLGLIAFLPLLAVVGLLVLSAVMTDLACYTCDDQLHRVLQWFFLMIPFTALLAPAVIFFFNFAAESHVWMQKQLAAE